MDEIFTFCFSLHNSLFQEGKKAILWFLKQPDPTQFVILLCLAYSVYLSVLPSLPLLLWHLWLLQCLAVQRCHSAERGWRVVEFCAGQWCLPFWCKLLGLSVLVCGFYRVLFCEDFWGTGGGMGLFHWSLFISISSFVRAFLLLLLLLMNWFAIALLIGWFSCFLNPSTATMSPENNQYNLEIWNLSSFFVFFVCLFLHCKKISIKIQCLEQRFVIETENILFADLCVHFSAQKFYRLWQWRG